MKIIFWISLLNLKPHYMKILFNLNYSNYLKIFGTSKYIQYYTVKSHICYWAANGLKIASKQHTWNPVI